MNTVGFARLILFFSYLALWPVQSAKILVLFPTPAHSHYTLGFRIATELASRGHEVTSINAFPQKTPMKNYKEISVVENVAIFKEITKILMSANSLSAIDNFKFLFDLGTAVTSLTLNNSKVQDLLNSDEKFDLIVIEHFVNEALIGLGHRFKAPVVLIGSLIACSFNNYLVSNPSPSSYVPFFLGTFTKHMTLFQRMKNLYDNILYNILLHYHFLPKQREIFNQYISKDGTLDNYLYNVSLVLLNSHSSINDPLPHVPAMVEVGGFHVKPPNKLPANLQEFLDEAKDGVILFSMGSNLKSTDLQPQIRDSILKAFSKIKQKVLWKFETELPDLPKNVKIMKWIPQQDVLAHPNVRAFISHGGLLSTIETIFHGVPIIGIPVFGDQMLNVAAAAEKGYAVNIPISELSEEKLSWGLNEIVNNPTYKNNAVHRSRLMHDQPLKPMDSAMFWIEHVIRHKGATHLRSSGIDLSWYQKEMLDVFVVLGLLIIITYVVCSVVVKKTIMFFKAKKTLPDKKNK